MREWLSGGVSPCQGEGRGFESRLVLFYFAYGRPKGPLIFFAKTKADDRKAACLLFYEGAL